MTPGRRSRLYAASAAALIVAVSSALVGTQRSEAAAAPPAAAQAVTQPPEPTDPSPVSGGSYYLINQASGLQAQASGTAVVAAARSFTDLSQRWGMVKAPDGDWLISNLGSGLCLAAQPSRRNGVAATVLAQCQAGVRAQEWTLSYDTNGYGTIRNASTQLALDTRGADLVGSRLARGVTQSQLWLLRPTYFLGNDSSLQEKSEADMVAADSDTAPWWHDGYLPGQDLLQIFKDQGMNMVRVRPASINTTVVHDGVSFPITTAPYNNYTLAPPPASQAIPASANPNSPGGVSSGDHAQTDWAAVDVAKRAKELGMAVNVTLFYSGDSTSETPGNWAGKTVDQLAGVPPHAGLMYDYVKQEMELFRANGAWPDLVSIGNEVNDGMFTTTGAGGLSPSGTNCTPTATAGGTGTANCFPRIQQAAMQAIADAASDTSDPALLGPPLPAPLTCIHVDGNPDLQTFFAGATQTNGIPLDVACESYYPGWHGPLTQAQQAWHPCNLTTSCGSTVQHVAESDFASEANGLGLPIFTIEDGVSYTTEGSPQDPYYGVSSPGPSRQLSRQGMIDLNKVEENIPNHLSLGMEWWAGEGNPVPGDSDVNSFWGTPGIGLFDSAGAAGDPADNAALPVLTAMGGKLDPTLAYTFSSAANGRILQTDRAATGAGATLGTGADTGITSLNQQWQILAQGADPEQNAATFPAPMDHRGDGFFQIANMNQVHGANLLDTGGATTSGSPVVQNPRTAAVTATTGTNADQEWDVVAVGNCGNVPAKCASPPLVSHGNGDYYMIINKATGNVLATTARGTVVQQAPAAPSNGDWAVPANKGQLWRITTARITATPPDLINSQLTQVGHAGGDSFAAQLRSVRSALAAGHSAQACTTLAAYTSHVRAQAGRQLRSALASQLLASAQVVSGLAGCPQS